MYSKSKKCSLKNCETFMNTGGDEMNDGQHCAMKAALLKK